MRTARPRHYLMCRPTYFDVVYSINPWMDPRKPVDTSLAVAQWEQLRQAYRDLGHTVELIDPLPGLPDMVFAANGATVIDGRALVARFRDAERVDEAPAYRSWLQDHGFTDLRTADLVNEGEGDYLLAGDWLLAGTGFPQRPALTRGGPGVLRPAGDQPDARRSELLPPGHGVVGPGREHHRLLPARLLPRQPGRPATAVP
uniref:Amidinotransferase n=1 Tax=Streptomyces sp. NRRL F-4415 TaxID=1286194 RepID=L7Z535_9ACTN|nr:amidinotransferase [Streptomyces sp. NRRL F-4415]